MDQNKWILPEEAEEERWTQRIWTDGFKRAAVIVTVLYIVVCAAVTVYNLLPGVFINRWFLPKRSDTQIGDDDRWISMMRTEDGADFTYKFYTNERAAHMTIRSGNERHFVFADGTTVQAGRANSWEKGYASDYAYYPSKEALADAMSNIYRGEFETRGSKRQSIVSVILYVTSIFIWLWPGATESFHNQWLYPEGADIPDWKKGQARVGACFLALLAFVALFIRI